MGSDASYTTQPLELLNTQGFDYTRKTMKGDRTPSTTATDGAGSDGDTYSYENGNSFASTPQRISNGDGQRHQNLSGVEVWVPDGQGKSNLEDSEGCYEISVNLFNCVVQSIFYRLSLRFSNAF